MHFSTLLNWPSPVDSDTLNQIPQQPVQVSLAKPPTIEEIKKAIHQTISGRALGKDGNPAEIYKVVGPDALGAFHKVLLTVWEEEMMPDDFRDALIVSLYKKKGSKSDYGNYRGISLFSVAEKIFARVILNRLITVPEQTLDLKVLDQAEATIIKAQLQWVGHVIRMEECRMLKRLMYGELQASKRNQGRPKLRYKDTVKANLQWCYINPRDLEGYAMDSSKWRGLVHRAAANFEEARCQKLTAARKRYRRAASAVIPTTGFQCPHCSRLCLWAGAVEPPPCS